MAASENSPWFHGPKMAIFCGLFDNPIEVYILYTYVCVYIYIYVYIYCVATPRQIQKEVFCKDR